MVSILCALAALAAAPWAAAAPYVSSNSFIDEECPSRSVPGLGSPTSVLVVTAHDVWAYDGATGAHEHVAASGSRGSSKVANFRFFSASLAHFSNWASWACLAFLLIFLNPIGTPSGEC